MTWEGKKESQDAARKLIEQYGLPDIIYYSPMFRTRQTVKEMVKVVEEYSRKKIKVKTEPRLGRFFTKSQRRKQKIRESTLYKGAILDETWDQFHERVDQHFSEIVEKDYSVIWNITHTLVLLRIGQITGIYLPEHISYSDVCIVKK